MEIGKPELTEMLDRAEALRKEVVGLRDAVVALKPKVERAERVSLRSAVATVLIVVLTVVVALIGYRQIVSDAQIHGICPVLALVIGSADPESRPAGPAREQYIEAIDVMRNAYVEIGCTEPFVPARE